MPPSKFLSITCISTDGVVDNPTSITLTPIAIIVDTIKSETIRPLSLPSLPITIVGFVLYFFNQIEYADANLTRSSGVRFFPS